MNESINIHAGWLIDGTGNPARKDILLQIINNQIYKIARLNREDIDNLDIIDLSRCTIMPGLVDSHVHLFMSGTVNQNERKKQLDSGFDTTKDKINSHLRNHFSHGILAVRDGGDNKDHTVRFKNLTRNKKTTPVIIRAAGMAWHTKGRYGKLIGRVPAEGKTLAQSISKESIDHVKIVNSGLNSLTFFGKETPPQFEQKELQEAINKAKELNLRVMVHANGKSPVKAAVEAGCHSIEHGFFMGRQNMELLIENKVTWVPTAFTMKAYSQCLKNNMTAVDVAKKNLEHQLMQISKAKELGLPIALGTDAGSIGVHHGQAVIEEIKLLKDAGYSIEEAIRCASNNGAGLLGLDNFGLLIKGRPATFVVTEGAPADLPENLNRIENIFIAGRTVKIQQHHG